MGTTFQQRKPDYIVKAILKDNTKTQRLGAAWKNDSGYITLKLDPCIVLNANDIDTIMLFNDNRE